MGVDVDVEFDFLDFLGHTILALRLEILLLLEEQFSEVHDPHHRRYGTIRHQHQIQTGALRQFAGLGQGYNVQLFSVRANETHRLRRERTISGF
ncbi:hypothetical protein SDC9_143040 [bioreactor metagenome]|uniref:Uncharacterized protein n=1 Tax=bioreactor metagenome TaxID=1076179 RepID=A0A645E269_9ZZZZ